MIIPSECKTLHIIASQTSKGLYEVNGRPIAMVAIHDKAKTLISEFVQLDLDYGIPTSAGVYAIGKEFTVDLYRDLKPMSIVEGWYYLDELLEKFNTDPKISKRSSTFTETTGFITKLRLRQIALSESTRELDENLVRLENNALSIDSKDVNERMLIERKENNQAIRSVKEAMSEATEMYHFITDQLSKFIL